MSRKPSSTSNVVARGGYAVRRAQTSTFNVVMRLDDKVVGTLGPYQTRRAALADARTLAYRKADTTGIVTLKSGNKAPLARVHRDFSDPKGLVESGYYLKSRRGKAQPLPFYFEVEVVDAHRSPVRPNPRRNGADTDAGVRCPERRSPNIARADSETYVNADKTRRVVGKNVKMQTAPGEYEVVRVYKRYTRDAAGKWRFYGDEWEQDAALAWMDTPSRRPNPRRNGSMPHHTEVQALLFHKAGFPVGKAKSWAKHHGFHYGRVEKGGERAHMLRLRQNDPDDYVPGSFRTISLADGVEAVIGLPKRAA
jgi:hypothetical protein